MEFHQIYICIYITILAIFRLGLLPVIFHKFVTELWWFSQQEKHYSRAIVRFSNNYSFYLNEVFCHTGR